MGKNWNAINNLGNPHLRMAFAQIPADSDLAKFLATAFPGCYTKGEDEGPIPLSVIMRKAWELGGGSDCDEERAMDVLGVPFLRYALDERQLAAHPDLMAGLLSEELQKANKIDFGATVTIEGHDYVIFYCSDNEIQVAPVERVLADTTTRRAALAA